MSVCSACNTPATSSSLVVEGQTYHLSCFKCAECSVSLKEVGYAKVDGKDTCGACIQKNTKPRTLIERPGTSYLRQAKPVTMSPVTTEKCAVCKKSVYANEKINSSGNPFHKSCFRCATCKRSLEAGKEANKEDQIYCSSCYGKNFGPKGYNIGSFTTETQ